LRRDGRSRGPRPCHGPEPDGARDARRVCARGGRPRRTGARGRRARREAHRRRGRRRGDRAGPDAGAAGGRARRRRYADHRRTRPDVERRLAERLLALQQADGSWPIYHRGPGSLSTTIEAYFALKLVETDAREPALARARDFILGQGGLARAGVFTRMWLAYF